ncbi:hypothetical protein acdb102_16040 [Acidothermaceae bacterium B102]|nr:hypothetical protein acdb102_16040 [Acidothermaceae bacterium B102]
MATSVSDLQLGQRLDGCVVVSVRDLRAGDFITELSTPAGPWYAVVSCGPNSVSFEGLSDDEDEDPLVVTVKFAVGGAVLRREPAPALNGNNAGHVEGVGQA